MIALVAAIAVGGAHSCEVTADAHVRCWGQNNHGQLGAQTGNENQCVGEQYDEEIEIPGICQPTPVQVPGLDGVKQLALGLDHTCALRRDGSVWCWGSNWMGELGTGTADGPEDCGHFPCSRRPLRVPGLRAKSIAAGGQFTCAVREDRRVMCWGDSAHEQITRSAHDKCTASRMPCVLTPTVVDGVDGVESLKAGVSHACALRRDGRVVCWGLDDMGQAGVPVDSAHECDQHYRCVQPTELPDLRARQIAVGGYHTCAETQSGEIVCWGRDDFGNLGSPGSTESWAMGTVIKVLYSSQPRAVKGLPRAAHLVDGASCALSANAEAWCWGPDEHGQLGVGRVIEKCFRKDDPDQELPCSRGAVRVDGHRFSSLASSRAHTCAREQDQSIWCWGSNESAETGTPPAPIDLCTYILPDQKTPCHRRPHRVR